MPTIIDSLLITIGLDPSGFQKGQKDIATSLKKTEEQVTKTGKTAEGSANQMAAGFETAARELLGLYALFTAGTEIKAFVTNITNADAALGRFASTIGVAPGAFASWSNAIERQGGSAAEAAAAFSNLNQSIQNLRANGQADGRIDGMLKIGALGGTPVDLWHGSPDAIFKQLNSDLASIRKRYGQAAASFRASEVGLGDNVGLFMSQDPAKVKEALAESERLGHANAASAKAAQDLLNVWRGLEQASEDLGRSVLTTLAPAIQDALKGIEHWIEANKEWLKNEINAKVREFVGFLRSMDWKAIGDGIMNFVQSANSAAGAVGGWKTAIELMFGLWTGAKFAEVIANVRLLRAAQVVPPGAGWAAVVAAAGYGAYREATDPYGNPNAYRGSGMVALRKHQRDRNEDQAGPWGTVRDAGKRAWNWVTGGGGGDASLANVPRSRRSRSASGWWTPNRQKEAYDHLTAGGMPATSAIALISRWANVESTKDGPASVNGIGAEGIGQWLGGRQIHNPDFHAQLDHVLQEYKTGSGDGRGVKASQALRDAQNDRAAAVAASAYERAEGYNPATGIDNFTGTTLAGMGAVRRNVMGGSSALPLTRRITTTMPPNPRAAGHSAFGGPVAGLHAWHSTLRDLHEATKPLPPHVVPGLVGLRAAAANRVAGGAGLSATSFNRSSTSETHIGEVHVHTKATDATGIARDMRSALENHAYASSANTGLK